METKTNQNESTTYRTFTIWESRLAELQKVVERMNRKCVKYGFPQIALIPLETGMCKHKGRNYPTITLFIDGPAPIISGWELVGHIDHQDGIVTKIKPDSDVSLSDYADSSFCMHCQTDRKRNHSYVLRNVQTNAIVRVGSTCVADYTGHKSALQIANLFESLSLLKEGFGGGEPNGFAYYELQYFIECALKVDGGKFVSKKQSLEQTGSIADSTAYKTEAEISRLIEARNAYVIENRLDEDDYRNSAVTAHADKAREIIETVANIDMTDGNDYLFNIKTIAENGYFKPNHSGYAASMIGYFNRLNQKPAAQPKSNEFIGQLGFRFKGFELTPIRVKRGESMYGLYVFTDCEDANGNSIILSNVGLDDQIGNKVTVDGTVSKQNEYKGRKQTTFNRVKVSK